MKRIATKRLGLGVLLSALLMTAGFAQAEKYQLVFDRDSAVGDKLRATTKGTKNQDVKQTMNGQALGEQKQVISGELTAVVEVVSVYDNKAVKSAVMTVEKFKGENNGEATKLDMTKRIMITVENGKTVFKYEGGGAIPGGTTEVLDLLVQAVEEDPEEASDDQVFKVTEPREAGTSWACDNELMAKTMSGGGEIVVNAKDIESEFKFVDVAEFNGKKAAAFEMTAEMDKFTFPGAAEQGLKMTKSEGKLSMSGLLPLDPKSHEKAMEIVTDMTIRASVPTPQGNVDMSVDINVQVSVELRDVE